MYKKLIFISLVAFLFLSNILIADSLDRDLIDKKIANLHSLDISTFYDSTLSLIVSLQTYSNRDFGLTKSNELFEIVKNRVGRYSNRLHWIHREVFSDSAKLYYLEQAGKLALRYNSETNIAWVNYTKSVFYSQKKIYDKSMKYLLEAKDIYESLSNKKYLSLISHLFGRLYFNSQLYEKAETYYQFAYDNIEGSQEFVNERQFILLNNIGYVYIKLENYDLAIKYFNTALKENFEKLSELQKTKAKSYLFASISEAYLENGKINQAKIFITKALNISKEEDEYFLVSSFNYVKSRIEYEESNFNEALISVKKAIKTLEKSKRSFVLRPKLLKHISTIYYELGNIDAAFVNLKKYNLLKEKLDKEANTTKSLLLIAEKEYEQINKENEKNRLKLIYSVWIAVFLLSFFLIMLFMYSKIRKANLKLIEKVLSKNEIVEYKSKNNSEHIDENLQTLIIQLNKLMETEKPYLDINFTLPKAASLLNTNTSYLSKAINTILDKNFNSYINEFKIKNSIELIESGEAEKITIEALAEKSGCKNRSVFNIAFKIYTGVTPSFFIKNYKTLKGNRG